MFTKPLRCREQRGRASYHHFRAFYFLACLRRVTSVGKEPAVALSQQQRPGAAGKSAKVTNVRKLANQKRMQPLLRELLL